MLILSQNKKAIVNLNVAKQICIDNITGSQKTYVFCDFGDERIAVLGGYETEKRATEILAGICEGYQYLSECSAICEFATKQPPFVFYMPGDE